MKDIRCALPAAERPVRAVQFGAGVFLRGFADWMLDLLNERTAWNGSVAMVKSTSRGSLDALRAQDGRYAVALRGLVDGQPSCALRGVTAVRAVVNSVTEYERYAALARLDSLRFVLSNTTEAGIVEDEGDSFALCPPRSFPGKLTKFLYERARCFDYAPDKGLIVLPMELIDDNGGRLRELVLRTARRWDLGERFENWVQRHCAFASTLVDRIVTGYPQDAPQLWAQLGYEDRALVAAEPYALWVIRCPVDLERELPLQRAGLPVVYASDLAPYKTRKVRILNGAHTALAPAAFLMGHDIVRDAVLDGDCAAFLRRALDREILSTVPAPEAEKRAFADAVLERFANPYIDHRLLAICLNSVSKWRERILPTLLDDVRRDGTLPPCLIFSLAALLRLYDAERADAGRMEGERPAGKYELNDDAAAVDFLAAHRGDVDAILAQEALWGRDLTAVPGLAAEVKRWARRIAQDGVRQCVKELGTC